MNPSSATQSPSRGTTGGFIFGRELGSCKALLAEPVSSCVMSAHTVPNAWPVSRLQASCETWRDTLCPTYWRYAGTRLIVFTVQMISHSGCAIRVKRRAAVKTISLAPAYLQYVGHRVCLQVSHEAWSLLTGQALGTVSTDITQEDTGSADNALQLSNSRPEVDPPVMPQLGLCVALVWIVQKVLTAGYGGVGMGGQ